MNSRTPVVIVLALLICCSFGRPVVSQTNPARKAPDATVAGKITIKGKPAPGIVVGLRLSQPTPYDSPLKATTDDEGNYLIRDVPAGSYVAAPIAPALVVTDANNGASQMIIITEGERVEGIDFELSRGGVITGKVTDADGHPIIEERVSLLPVEQRTQRGPITRGSNGFLTDDRGIFRMFGVPPGRYKIAVGDAVTTPAAAANRGRPAYPLTFYPDATDPAKASVIEIDEGVEAKQIDITLGSAIPGFTLSGRIVDGETGKPVRGVAIELTEIKVLDARNSSSSSKGSGGSSDNRGEFRVPKLPAGKYTISIYPPAQSDLMAEPVTVDVVDQDVAGVVIKTSLGASITGTLVFEGASDRPAAAVAERVFISALINRDGLAPAWSRADWVPADGSFRLGGLEAGIAIFSIGSSGNSRRVTVLRVERDGVAQPKGIQIRPAEHVTGVRVVAGSLNGSIRGVVKLENGTLPTGGRLIIQVTKAGDANANVSSAMVDSRGHFLVEGLATGNYELRATAFAPAWPVRPSVKQLVSVSEGSATEVVLTIDLAATPTP